MALPVEKPGSMGVPFLFGDDGSHDDTYTWTSISSMTMWRSDDRRSSIDRQPVFVTCVSYLK